MMSRFLMSAVVLATVLLAASAESHRGLEEEAVVRQVLPPNAEKHPKLVALLMARGEGRPDWRGLNSLPGVWQDLARMKRRLESLGFGKIVALAGHSEPGSSRTIQVKGLPGLAEWERAGSVTLMLDGPATRAGVVRAAGELGEHLHRQRTSDDGEVRPVFVFYYSGYGFTDTRGVHRLPLADNVKGEPTGALISLILDEVGANDPARGSVGGGISLVFLDCCQAGRGPEGGSQRRVGYGGWWT